MEKQGLTSEEAYKLHQQYGPNKLPEKPPVSDATIFLNQIKSPLIYILLVAAGISFYLADVADAAVIMIAVVLNSILGFYQERKAERGLEALKKILTPKAKVIRDGQQVEIAAETLVPGDLVIITSGDKVPADGVLVEVSALTINEAILTGESAPVSKTEYRSKTIGSRFGDVKNISPNSQVFMGTTVVGGVGKFIVSKIGADTEMGHIAMSLKETPEESTPLQKRFADLARILTWVVVGVALLIFITGTIRAELWVEMFTTAVAVAVAAIPEGLVIALTAILALGMQRILQKKALVRKLVVAETLGTVTVIATDKTGTLTEGQLKVVKTHFTDKQRAMEAATYANQLLDPLELALWEWLMAEPNFDPEEFMGKHPRKFVLPFDSSRMYAGTVYDHGIYLLGAPEVILEKSKLPQTQKARVYQTIEKWAREGLRLLAIAYKKADTSQIRDAFVKDGRIHDVEFLGLVGFADPVRKGVKEALSLCRGAGISVKVVTGDYRWTAETVLSQVGLKIQHPEKQILEGEELEKLSSEELKSRVKEVVLFARVTPKQKLNIVQALKDLGESVALVGDGVNDAPALKKADIGIVVGEASDVAKETADLVLLDSQFATIVAAVEEGRGIFINIQKVMVYLLSDTFAEVTLIFLGLVFGTPLPLTAAQILWINLVTDTFPTLALTTEPKEKGLLKQKPIATNLPILSPQIALFLVLVSLTSGVAVFILFNHLWTTTGNLQLARMIAFSAFSLKSLLYVFSLRERHLPVFLSQPFANGWLWLGVGISLILQLIGLYAPTAQILLDTRALTLYEWGLVVGTGVIIVLVIEGMKLAHNLLLKKEA